MAAPPPRAPQTTGRPPPDLRARDGRGRRGSDRLDALDRRDGRIRPPVRGVERVSDPGQDRHPHVAATPEGDRVARRAGAVLGARDDRERGARARAVGRHVSTGRTPGLGARPRAERNAQRPPRAGRELHAACERALRCLRERGPHRGGSQRVPDEERATVLREAERLLGALGERFEVARGVRAVRSQAAREIGPRVERQDQRPSRGERRRERAPVVAEAALPREQHDHAPRDALRRVHLHDPHARQLQGSRRGRPRAGRREEHGEHERDHRLTTPFRPRDTSAATFVSTIGRWNAPGAARKRGRHSGANFSLYWRSPWKL